MWFDIVVLMAVFRAFQLLFRRRRNNSTGSDGALKLKVARTFWAVYGGNIFQALRIPDTGRRGHQVIDALLLTERELFIFGIQNSSGVIRVASDDCWVETDSAGNPSTLPNAVIQLQEKANTLVEYISRRGVTLPKDFIKLRVVFVNALVRPQQEILLLPEVVSYDAWEDILKKATMSSIFGIESYNMIASTSKICSHPIYTQLPFILNTAPTWDRLQLRNGGILFGDFIRFKGPANDLEALAVGKRSKISHYEAFHPWSFWSFLGVHTNSDVKIVCTLRDYRQGSAAKPDTVEMHVRTDVEVLFQVEGTSKPGAYLLRDIFVLALRA